MKSIIECSHFSFVTISTKKNVQFNSSSIAIKKKSIFHWNRCFVNVKSRDVTNSVANHSFRIKIPSHQNDSSDVLDISRTPLVSGHSYSNEIDFSFDGYLEFDQKSLAILSVFHHREALKYPFSIYKTFLVVYIFDLLTGLTQQSAETIDG